MKFVKQAIAIATLLPLSTFFTTTASAETAVRDDGRRIRLLDNGQWEFIGEDVFATSESGVRVKLNSDGTWFAESSPSKDHNNLKQHKTKPSSIQVAQIIIQRVEKSRSQYAKNRAYTENIVIKLTFSKAPKSATLGKENFKVLDSKGNEYAIINIQPINDTTVLVRADGAPSLLSRVKFIEIFINKAVTGTLGHYSLNSDMRDIRRQVVPKFQDI